MAKKKQIAKPLLRNDHVPTARSSPASADSSDNQKNGLVLRVKLKDSQYLKIGTANAYPLDAQKSVLRLQTSIKRRMQLEKPGGTVCAEFDGAYVAFYYVATPAIEPTGQQALPIVEQLQEVLAEASVKMGDDVVKMTSDLADDEHSTGASGTRENDKRDPDLLAIVRDISAYGMTLVREEGGALLDCPVLQPDKIPTLPVDTAEEEIKYQGVVTGLLGDGKYVLDNDLVVFEYGGVLETSQYVEIAGSGTKKSLKMVSIDGAYTVTTRQFSLPGV